MLGIPTGDTCPLPAIGNTPVSLGDSTILNSTISREPCMKILWSLPGAMSWV